MDRPWVDVSFDCIPLRSIGRLDVPIDASPKFRQRCKRISDALQKHGSHNAYYLASGKSIYHLMNDDDLGRLEFTFEGTVLTDSSDVKTARCDLQVELVRETCDWLSEPIVDWFKQTVGRTVAVEFDHYIAAGDLKKTVDRIARLQAESDDAGGYVGMYL